MAETFGVAGSVVSIVSDGRVFSEGNAELLVYLVDEEKDIYIGVCRFAI
jgi:hypothetical protein